MFVTIGSNWMYAAKVIKVWIGHFMNNCVLAIAISCGTVLNRFIDNGKAKRGRIRCILAKANSERFLPYKQ